MNDNDPIVVSRFSTDRFAPRDRFEAWENRDWPAIGRLFESRPTAAFHNRSDRFALGGTTVHVSDIAGQVYRRDTRQARIDGLDALLIPITITGAQRGDAAGTSVRASGGSITLVDLAQAEAHQSTESRTVMLSLPRAAVERDGVSVRGLHGRVIGAGTAELLITHLQRVHERLPHLTVADGRRLEQITRDLLMVTLSLGATGAAIEPRARDTAKRTAARGIIEAELEFGGLSVDHLCRRLRLSRAALYRLFEADGGVQTYIRSRRLARVRELIARDPASAISPLAERLGFADAAHLSRLFRQAFDVSPSDFRAAQRKR